MRNLFSAINFVYNTFVEFFGEIITKIVFIIIAIAIIVFLLVGLIKLLNKVVYYIKTKNMTQDERYKYDQHHRR